MPNATVRANAQAMPMSRRAALGGISAVGALFVAPAGRAAMPSAIVRSLTQEFEEAWAAEREAALAYSTANDLEWEHTVEPFSERTSALVKRIIAEPAKNIDGLRLKGRAYLWCYSNDPEEALGVLSDRGETTDAKLIHAILRDLLALGGEA